MTKDLDIPDFVYRAFQEERHALDFIDKGILRMGNLHGYRIIEDEARKDSTEGVASYQFEEDIQQLHLSKDLEIIRTSTKRGLMNVNSNWGNPTFIFCTSLPAVNVSYLKEKFGEHIVQINDPAQLMADMQEAILRTDYPFIGQGLVHGRYVEYSKGEVLRGDLEEMDSCELATYQKPSIFFPENEYRFIAFMNAIKPPKVIPEFVELNVGRALRYANMC